MGSYTCRLKDKLKPATHDPMHWDGYSNVCPVLRDELEKAVVNENWKRFKKLIKLGEDSKML